jgi:hypothetical protein
VEMIGSVSQRYGDSDYRSNSAAYTKDAPASRRSRSSAYSANDRPSLVHGPTRYSVKSSGGHVDSSLYLLISQKVDS